MTPNKCYTQSGKSKIWSDFRKLNALHNLSEGKTRSKTGISRVTFLHFHELMGRV